MHLLNNTVYTLPKVTTLEPNFRFNAIFTDRFEKIRCRSLELKRLLAYARSMFNKIVLPKQIMKGTAALKECHIIIG